jgi:hypothetical protein
MADSGRTISGVGASLSIVILALTFPVEFGVKLMLSGRLCPAAIVAGILGETRENSALLTAADARVTPEAVLLMTVTVSVLLPPTTTLPKSRDPLLSVKSLLLWRLLEELFALNSWQAGAVASTRKMTSTFQRTRRSFTEGLLSGRIGFMRRGILERPAPDSNLAASRRWQVTTSLRVEANLGQVSKGCTGFGWKADHAVAPIRVRVHYARRTWVTT